MSLFILFVPDCQINLKNLLLRLSIVSSEGFVFNAVKKWFIFDITRVVFVYRKESGFF